MNKMDEMIIVAPRSKVFEYGKLLFQGSLSGQMVDMILENINGSYKVMRRGEAENDSNFKQPIPYAFLRRGDEIFVYERLKGAGETRLHNKLSIGVGGHMNDIPGSTDFAQLLGKNLVREIEEELILTNSERNVIRPLGLINDDSDEVGRVHIGILLSVKLDENTKVEVRETEELSGRFIPIEQLKQGDVYERLENWSKIVVDIL